MGSFLLFCFESDLLPELFVLLVEIEDLHPEEGLLFLLFLNEVHELLNLVLDSHIRALIMLDGLIQLILEAFELTHLALDRILELLDIQHIWLSRCYRALSAEDHLFLCLHWWLVVFLIDCINLHFYAFWSFLLFENFRNWLFFGLTFAVDSLVRGFLSSLDFDIFGIDCRSLSFDFSALIYCLCIDSTHFYFFLDCLRSEVGQLCFESLRVSISHLREFHCATFW